MNVTIGHICMFLACAIWGLMAPLGKDAMTHGVGGLEMVTFRVVGGAVCFWIASLFVKQENVRHKDMLLFFFAAMLSIVLNQCCTMILAALFLKEPITGKKVMGVFCGAVGAFLLITTGARVASGNGGVLLGDLLCLSAQLCFAIYLTVFKHLIQRYTVITCMKWMITYAAIVIMPISFSRMQQLPWADIPAKTWWETAFVVVGGTFLAYIFMMQGQKILRPTVVAMYNYVQPIIACIVSVAIGLGVFGLWQALAVVLVFFGVWLVTQSKSRRDLKKENHNNK